MFDAIKNPYLVPFDGTFSLRDAKTSVDASLLDERKNKKKLEKQTEQIYELQRLMLTTGRIAIL